MKLEKQGAVSAIAAIRKNVAKARILLNA